MKKATRSLTLNKETIRALNPTALAGIVGGLTGLKTTWTTCDACSTFGDSGCDPGHSVIECQTQPCIVSHQSLC